MTFRTLWERNPDRATTPYAVSHCAAGAHQADCFKLVRQERLVVGPSTAPYPLNHETVLTSSASYAELNNLREKLAGNTGGSALEAIVPESWVDALPGERAVSYDIRKV